jgi:hypothetical protein
MPPLARRVLSTILRMVPSSGRGRIGFLHPNLRAPL